MNKFKVTYRVINPGNGNFLVDLIDADTYDHENGRDFVFYHESIIISTIPDGNVLSITRVA